MNELNSLITNLQTNISSHITDNIIFSIHEINNKVDISLLSNDPQTTLEFFKETYTNILPLKAQHLKSLSTCLDTFYNHWNNLLSSLCPSTFISLCQTLFTELHLSRFMDQFLAPLSRIVICEEQPSQYSELLLSIIMDSEIEEIIPQTQETWRIIESIISPDDSEKLVDYFLSKNCNEFAVAVLGSKNPDVLYEKVFTNATMEYISKFLTCIPQTVRYPLFTISSRIADSIVLEGYDPNVAFEMIPYLVHGDITENEESNFHPFWPSIKRYLKDNNSVSALYALQAGYKVKLVKDEELIPFLKFEADSNVDQQYRLASFQIAIEMFDCKELQPRLVEAIKYVSLTRGNAILFCLVDHLCALFPKLIEYDKNFAYDVINSIMTPIPYDQFMPPYILRFLNSLDDPRDPKFTFDVEEIIYKYLNLTTNIASEMKKLIHKIGMKIDMNQVDWIDTSLSLSLLIVDDVLPDILYEILSRNSVHISYVPTIIDKLAFICNNDDDQHYFYNSKTVNCSLIYEKGISTLITVMKYLGLNIEEELQKRNIDSIQIKSCFMPNSYLEGCVGFLREPIAPSYLGSIIRSLIKLLISKIDDVAICQTLAIVADFLTSFMSDQSLFIIDKIKEKLGDDAYISQIETKALTKLQMANPIISTKYLLKTKTPEQVLEMARRQVIKAASFDFEVAKVFAPLLDQPLERMKTFSAFEGIEKHNDWVIECKNHFNKDQWITQNQETITFSKKREDAFQFEKPSIQKGMDGFLDETKYSIISYLYFSSERNNKKILNQDIDINKLEEYVMQNSSDIRLVIGFFYYAIYHKYHTHKYKDWCKLLTFNRTDDNLYAASLFLASLVKTNLHLNLPEDNQPQNIALTQQQTETKSSTNEQNEQNESNESNDQNEVKSETNEQNEQNQAISETNQQNEQNESNDQNETGEQNESKNEQNEQSQAKSETNDQNNEINSDGCNNEALTFKFDEIPDELKEFILSGLKSIGYYSLTKGILVYAFHHEFSFRWFFIRSIISLDVDHFKDKLLILIEFSEPDQAANLYKSLFDQLTTQNKIDTLLAIFISITQIYFIPKQESLLQNRLYPLIHNCLYGIKNSVFLPPPVKLDNSVVDSLLDALSKQKFFPISFFAFFAHISLTSSQYKLLYTLLEPKTQTASNFFSYLFPSAYYDENVKQASEKHNSNSKGSNAHLQKTISNSISVDKNAAIHFSNKPPSFSRAFYRSLMIPFTPLLPQKLIVEIQDLLCPVYPAFAYNSLNAWTEVNDYDLIMNQKYPDNFIDYFKMVGHETLDIYHCAMSDSKFTQRDEITDQILQTALSDISNANFAVDVCNELINARVDVKAKIHQRDVVNNSNLFCFSVFVCHAKRKLQLDQTFIEEVSSLFDDENKKNLFLKMNQNQEKKQIIHSQF